MPNPETLPIITTPDGHYVRLKAVIWQSLGLGLSNNLPSSVGTQLTTLLSRVKKGGLFVVNCSGVSTIDQQHGLASLKERIAKNSDSVLFISENATFIGDLKDALGNPAIVFTIDGETKGLGYGKITKQAKALHKSVTLFVATESKETCKAVRDCFERHVDGKLHRLHSTPLRSNGIFNARDLISAPRTFSLIATQLAERLEAIIQKYRPANPVVLAVSLRGSPLAAAAALLSNPNLEIEIVDHMGPMQAVLEEYSTFTPRARLDYIYIGDFLIGGSEIRSAVSYACAHGCTLKHALVTGSLLPPDDYKGGPTIDALVHLPKCLPGLDYKL